MPYERLYSNIAMQYGVILQIKFGSIFQNKLALNPT